MSLPSPCVPVPSASLPPGTSHLVVAANRLAMPGSTQTGGLATALRAALADSGGTWVGWSGRIGEGATQTLHERGVHYRAMELAEAQHRDYYLGFSNRALWPLLHSRVDLVEYEGDWLQAWLQVNRRFADEIAGQLRPDSRIWVHDYHLVPLAGLLRERGVRQPIGFFLHTPFPCEDVVRSLPFHADVFDGLRAYDLVGVQTRRDAAHLQAYLDRHGGAPVRTAVRAIPIGVDPDAIAADAEASSGHAARRRLTESLGDRQLVVGVDRMDYSKGLPERFRAYGRMLERHADLRRQVSYLQIAPISRGDVAQYRELKTRLDGIAGAINGRHSDADWVPLRYVARSYPHAVVSAYLREASVGLVTPLRDGMNLVAKEFVAAQPPHDPGVLVLSEFAGAAEQMQDALLVNPYDTGAVADALARALRMPLQERRRRWESLMAGLRTQPLEGWRRSFLQALDLAAASHRQAAVAPAATVAGVPR